MTAPAPAPTRALWLDHFEAFSIVHFGALAALALVIVAVSYIGARIRRRGREFVADLLLASIGFAAWLAVEIWWLRPDRFTWGNSLPLQVCDLAGLVAPIAIITNHRAVRSLLFFWGIGLCTQGLVTPVAPEGPAHLGFWMTWINHGAIALLAVYDLVVREFRPTWRDLGRTLLITTAYAVCMFTIDAILGWNYGYLGPTKPGATTILDTLGPWPARVPFIMLLGAFAMTSLMVICHIASWIPRRSAKSPSDAGEHESGGE